MGDKCTENSNLVSTKSKVASQNQSTTGDHAKNLSNQPSAKHAGPVDTETASQHEGLVVRLEPSLDEKLIRTQTLADEFEDKLHGLRSEFVDRVHFIEIIKEDLNRRGQQLLKSVDNIEAYMKEIHSLKCEGDEMCGRLEKQLEKHNKEFFDLTKEYENVMQTSKKRLNVFRVLSKAKQNLESIVQDFPTFSSTRNLVEYLNVLHVLRDDITREIESHLEEERLREEQEKVAESLRAHPLNVLVKENIILELKSKIKEARTENALNEQQIDSTITAKVKDDLDWYDIKRWITKVCSSIDVVFPPRFEEPDKGATSAQFQKILDFVVKGTQVVDILKNP